MKTVLVIGGGGREHAIVDTLARSPQVGKIYCAPGNAGIAEQAECVAIKDTDIDALLLFAKEHKVDLTIVGPEAALAVGIVDRFREEGQVIFGHTQAATQIESSKEFAKRLMAEKHIPTASYQVFTSYEEACAYVQKGAFPTVIKYDGLAAGKGVVVAQNMQEADAALRDMLEDAVYGEGRVVIEEFMTGPEFSLMAFVSGGEVYPMPAAQDHKRAFDGDKGPNTGGMGAYTPLPFLSTDDYTYTIDHILRPVVLAMQEAGMPLSGVLYGGLMKTPQGIRVVEFNARFGDPETEVVLPLLESDPYDIFYAMATGTQPSPLRWQEKAVIGVVLASKGYPAHYDKGFSIQGVDSYPGRIFHMGTKRENGQLLTDGGRVMMCLMEGADLKEAHRKVYESIQQIQCDKLFYRHDIGKGAQL